jgi:four helix bundle protein
LEERGSRMDRRPAQKFQDLLVWQKSHALALRVYRTTATFPKQEVFGLTAQMRRAVVSVAANIAEGFSKRGRSDKARFMNMSQGSLEELRYYTILARDLEYLPPNTQWSDIDDIARLLGAYVRTLLTPSSQLPAPSS